MRVDSTFGSYRILAAIGAGGMGEVYRARDTKLDRDVAIKVLPEAFNRNPDRLGLPMRNLGGWRTRDADAERLRAVEQRQEQA